MTDTKVDLGAITLFVRNPTESRDWYAQTLGLECVYEDANSAVMSFANTMINLLQEAEAPDMIKPARVASRESGVRMQFTIWVNDIIEVVDRLVAIGVPLNNGPIDRAWGQRTLTVTDPDGFLWEFAQKIDES